MNLEAPLAVYREAPPAPVPPKLFDANTMAIPLHNRMSPDDYAYVVDALLALT